MKPDQQHPTTVYMLAAEVAGQVGCFLALIIGAFVGIGLLLDHFLGTRPLFLLVFLLGSIPLNLWGVYQYTKRKSQRLQTIAQSQMYKEGNSNDD